MVKVSITNENGKASVNLDVPYSRDTILDITNNLCNILSYPNKVSPYVCNATKEDIERIEEIILEEEKKHPTILTAPTKERPAFRDRLPNNVVDINDLTIEQAITENALVRCPHCGQSHAIIVKSNSTIYLMRKDYDKNEFVTISEVSEENNWIDMCCKEDTDKQAYFHDLQNAPEIKAGDFVVDNDTEIFCPVCCKSEEFLIWKDAWKIPLSYFETEELCDACGGETLDKLTKGKHTVRCEVCGLEREIPKL